MTEASSKRPTQLLEDLVDQRKQSEGPEVKVTEKQKIFQARMDNYVRSLKRKNETVTPLKFKRRAVEVCAKLHLVYDDLPMDWKDKLDVENVLKKREPKLSTPGKESGSITTEVEQSQVHHGNFKRLVDFAKNPPPPYWTKKFAEGGAAELLASNVTKEGSPTVQSTITGRFWKRHLASNPEKALIFSKLA